MTAIRRTSASNLAKYQSITLENIMATLIGEAMGFHFGKPKRVEDKALAVVLPILRDGKFERDYLVYSETEGVIATDSGMINKVNLKNNTDKKVFVRSGTVFAGKGTQSRTITRSAILFPGKEIALDARCVHASHGIRTGSEFSNYGTISIDVEKSVMGVGYTPLDQSTYWSAVNTSNMMKSMCFVSTDDSSLSGEGTASLDFLEQPIRSSARPSFSSGIHAPVRGSIGGARGARSSSPSRRAGSPPFAPARHRTTTTATPPRDSYVANDTVFTANLDDILTKVKLHDDQVGISLITDRGVETIELFEVHQSWAALHKDSVKRMGTELIKEEKEDVFEYKPEKAIEQVTRVLGQDFDANVIYEHKADGADRVVITGLTSASHIGEAVELGGKLIHLSLLKRAA
jgi:hypothetical protein